MPGLEMNDNMRKYRMALDTDTQGDVLGGPVSADNAAFTLMSVYISGPPLENLLPGEHQIREGTTADSRRAYRKSQKQFSTRLRYYVYWAEDE